MKRLKKMLSPKHHGLSAMEISVFLAIAWLVLMGIITAAYLMKWFT